MRILLFAKRNAKEVLRDPINFFFGLGFPLLLLALLTIVNSSIPAEANNTMFSIETLAPGLAMFGTAFFALFGGMLISKDRASSFLMRLFASPMSAVDFIMGYTIPLVFMAMVQAAITLLASYFAGLEITLRILPTIGVTTLTSLLFIGLGLLCGSLMNEKAVGGICGALLTNIAGWFSGVFIPIELIGGVFKKVAEILPFYHSVHAIRAALSGSFAEMIPHITIVLGYTVVVFVLAIIVFHQVMKGDRG